MKAELTEWSEARENSDIRNAGDDITATVESQLFFARTIRCGNDN